MSTADSAVFWFRPNDVPIIQIFKWRPPSLALAATVTYHRIILISCRKTVGGSCRGVRHLAEKGITGYAHLAAICDRVQTTPCHLPSPRPPHSIHPLRQKPLSPFSQFPERGGREKPTRKFQARFSHSRNSTLRDAVKGLLRTCAIISRNSFHFKRIRMKFLPPKNSLDYYDFLSQLLYYINLCLLSVKKRYRTYLFAIWNNCSWRYQ